MPGGQNQPKAPDNGRQSTKVLVAIVVVLAVAVVALAAFLPGRNSRETSYAVTLPVDVPGLDDKGTRIPVQATGTDVEDGDAAEAVRGYVASDGTGLLLTPGTWSVLVIASPISSEGAIYNVENTEVTVVVTVVEEGDVPAKAEVSAPIGFDELVASEVTDDVIAEAREWAKADEQVADRADELADKAIEHRDEAVAEEEKRAEAEALQAEEEKQAEEAAAKEEAENASAAARLEEAYAANPTELTLDNSGAYASFTGTVRQEYAQVGTDGMSDAWDYRYVLELPAPVTSHAYGANQGQVLGLKAPGSDAGNVDWGRYTDRVVTVHARWAGPVAGMNYPLNAYESECEVTDVF